MLAYGPALKERYRGRGGYVGVDLFMPYVKGSPGKTVAPDLFAALAAKEDEDRSSYKLWEEPAPDFVLEDLSPANWRRDAVDKRVLYQRFGVREYFMFDETAKRLRDDSGARLGVPLVGYRLRDGEYQRMPANDAGRLPSEALGLSFASATDWCASTIRRPANTCALSTNPKRKSANPKRKQWKSASDGRPRSDARHPPNNAPKWKHNVSAPNKRKLLRRWPESPRWKPN